MARPSGPKTRNNNEWTEARFHSFIKSLLRSGTRRWGPKQSIKKKARVERGMYKCSNSNCSQPNGIGPATIKVNGKRVDNAVVDHIKPIIDPEVGFTTWDDCIERMFCEEDNLQVLCHTCHTEKSNIEREQAKQRRSI